MLNLVTRSRVDGPMNASEENPEHIFGVEYSLIGVEWGGLHDVLGVALLPSNVKIRWWHTLTL